jgi:hypothetical protein
MATPQGTVETYKSARGLKEALDALTATLGDVRGCEYPRLIAREIQALVVACMAHEKAKHAVLNGALMTGPVEAPVEASVEAPVEASVEAPVEAAPVETAPVEAAVEEPDRLTPATETTDTAQLRALLEAREAEIATLRELLHHGVDTIETHTLTDPEGTAVMLHGDYQCVSAIAIEQWVDRAEAALEPAPGAQERRCK